MKTLKLIIPVIFLAALGGCTMVNDEEWGKLNQDIADLKRESQDTAKAKEALRLQLDDERLAIEGLKKQIQDMEKSTTAELTSRINAAEKALSDAEKDLRKKQADMVADITAIRSEFQVLTGRFEETRYAMQKSVKEGKVSQEEVDSRNKETSERIDDLNKRIASLEQAVALMRQEREQGKEEVKEKAAEVTPFEDAYKDAYETYQKKDYKAAREKFQNYLETYPNTKYSDNAQYWIGESYYSEKNYEKAIVVYDDVVKKYPDGAKAPAALLKQGMAFSAIGDKKSANAIYKKVIAAYPKSEQADVARKRLKE